MRICQKLPPCPMEPVPDSSKMNMLLDKAEPISNGGNASVVKHLRRGKNCYTKGAGTEV